MFTQDCFIRKNTAGLRRRLRKIGYMECMTMGRGKSYITINNNNDEYNGSYDIVSADVINNMGFRKPHVDCGENEELFLAIAALRDDSDKHQLFFHNKDIECEYPIECIHDKFHLIQVDEYLSKYKDRKNEFHKAQVEELIKHFK